MYDDRCSPEFINGVRTFLLAAEANKWADGFMSCPCVAVRMIGITLSQKPFTSTCLSPVSCPTIMFGPSMEKEGL